MKSAFRHATPYARCGIVRSTTIALLLLYVTCMPILSECSRCIAADAPSPAAQSQSRLIVPNIVTAKDTSEARPSPQQKFDNVSMLPTATPRSTIDSNDSPLKQQLAETPPAATPMSPTFSDMVGSLIGTGSLGMSLSAVLVMGVASLAPAVLLMTTSFVRMSVVLSLVRQGLGTQQLPSNQIVTSLAIFLTAMVMWPVWTAAWQEGVEPYQQGRMSLNESFDRGSLPVRRWMASQIEQSGNRETMLRFLKRHPTAPHTITTYDEVPLETLLPAFLVSELETAFSIGFRILLPFLVIDLIVATLVVSTGLVMLPPTLVSLPLKLLIFVLADGWSLVVMSLLDGAQIVGT